MGRISTRTVQKRNKLQANDRHRARLIPHLLGHCFASHILSDSGDLRAFKTVGGHSDISTTQIYTHGGFLGINRKYDKAHPRPRQ